MKNYIKYFIVFQGVLFSGTLNMAPQGFLPASTPAFPASWKSAKKALKDVPKGES